MDWGSLVVSIIVPAVISGAMAVWVWFTARSVALQKQTDDGIAYNRRQGDTVQTYNEATQMKALEVVLRNNDQLIANLITLNNGHFIKLTEEVANAGLEHSRQLQELVAAFNRFLVLEAQQASRHAHGINRSLEDTDELMATAIKTGPVQRADKIVATATETITKNE